MRFTEDEYKIAEQLGETLGISKAELVKMRLLENAPAVSINTKALISAPVAIGAEMGCCGK